MRNPAGYGGARDALISSSEAADSVSQATAHNQIDLASNWRSVGSVLADMLAGVPVADEPAP